MITLKQLSEICGVSVSTASKAMNGQPDVNTDTAKRIKQIARDLGYYPNAAARSLKTNRSYNLGVLFADRINHEYFALILDSIREAAKDSGYDITFICNRIGSSEISFYHYAVYRNCDGVIIAQARYEQTGVVELATSDLPIVVLDHVFPGRVSIMSENVQSMVEIMWYAAGMGHRKIAFIHGEERSTVTQKRISGFYKGCMELGIRAPEEYVIEAKYHSPKESGLATRRLLSLPSPPTCILYPDDYSYLGGLSEIEKHGLSVPEDVSAVGYDGIYLSTLLRPKLTTYHQDAETIGKMAVAKLIEQIEQPKKSHGEQTIIKGELQLGKSVKQIGDDIRGQSNNETGEVNAL
ncbi:MAG: LacI family DNA-binding transcriptional regulator [Christensenellales bacterium]